MPPLVTLTTDFGTRDSYVAQMKGVLLKRCPDAQLVDLTHEIAPQDIGEGAWFLGAVTPRFPPRTVHIGVVDPGVGTGRKPLAIAAMHQYFIGPDNGLFSLVFDHDARFSARMIANPACMAATISATFHGRDIFAPAAAALASGLPFDEIGPVVPSPHRLTIPKLEQVSELFWRGQVIQIDRFGNLVTNVHERDLDIRSIESCSLGTHQVTRVVNTYGDAKEGEPVLLIGSLGYLEIAVPNGSAEALFQAHRGTIVEIGQRS